MLSACKLPVLQKALKLNLGNMACCSNVHDIEPYHRKNAIEIKGTAVAAEGTGPNNYTVLRMGPDS